MNNQIQNINDKINTLNFLVFFIRILAVVFFIYSGICFLFWFLNCLEVDGLYNFSFLFIYPYKLVSMVYKPQGISLDFTLAIIGGVSCLIGFIFNNSVNIIYEIIFKLEDKKDKIKAEQKRIREKKLAKKKAAKDINTLVQDGKLVFLITPHMNKIKRQKDDFDLTFQEIEYWKQTVNKEIIKKVNFVKPVQKGYYRKNLFMQFKDFACVDDFVYFLKPTLASISLDAKKEGVLVTFSIVLSAIFDNDNLEAELDCMDTILSLNLTEYIIVTGRFKINYDARNNSIYLMKLLGEYNLSKNLTVSNNQPIYSLLNKENATLPTRSRK